jgi:hypothetical protein
MEIRCPNCFNNFDTSSLFHKLLKCDWCGGICCPKCKYDHSKKHYEFTQIDKDDYKKYKTKTICGHLIKIYGVTDCNSDNYDVTSCYLDLDHSGLHAFRQSPEVN